MPSGPQPRNALAGADMWQASKGEAWPSLPVTARSERQRRFEAVYMVHHGPIPEYIRSLGADAGHAVRGPDLAATGAERTHCERASPPPHRIP